MATACTSRRRSASAASRTLASSSGTRTAPPGPTRSITSRTRSGGTGRRGFTQENRLAARGMSWRPISMTWRKPAVVTKAVRAVLPSRIRLVATVVPCRTRVIASGVALASASAVRTPAMNPSERSVGVLGTLARQVCPTASARVMSVKVPPISTATERAAAFGMRTVFSLWAELPASPSPSLRLLDPCRDGCDEPCGSFDRCGGGFGGDPGGCDQPLPVLATITPHPIAST